MATDEASVLIIVLVAAAALVGLGLSTASFATQRDFGHMGGGMMDGDHNVTPAGPGGLEWGVFILSTAVFLAALALLLRGRSRAKTAQAVTPTPAIVSAPVGGEATSVPATAPATAEAVPELTLMRLLDEDEKRMYLEIRDHGGQMYQKDLVALGTFSKAKVTRVLDRLEVKGLVVRERHGMTNRVRIVGNIAK